MNEYNPNWECNWLLGARYLYFSDGLTLTGRDDYYNTTEQVFSDTFNNLIGAQTGLLFKHGWNRFQWDAGLKFGVLANIHRQHISNSASGPSVIMQNFIPYNVANNGSDASLLFEVSLSIRYRITKNLWLRIGYQLYDITGLALGPKQLSGLNPNGIGHSGNFNHSDNVWLNGLLLGLQANW